MPGALVPETGPERRTVPFRFAVAKALQGMDKLRVYECRSMAQSGRRPGDAECQESAQGYHMLEFTLVGRPAERGPAGGPIGTRSKDMMGTRLCASR